MGLGGIIKANRIMTTPEQEALKNSMGIGVIQAADDIKFVPFIGEEIRKRIALERDEIRRLKSELPKNDLSAIDIYNKGRLYEMEATLAYHESLLK